jgi:hypothetical protein
LGLSLQEQQSAERMFRRIRKNVRKNWKNPSHKCSVVITPTPSKTIALALYAFRNEEKRWRHQRMRTIASQIFVNPNIEKCLVIGVDIDKRGYPYSTLAVFFAGEGPKGENADDLVVY